MPYPLSRARDSVLLDTALHALGQYDGKDEGPAIKAGFQAVRLNADRYYGRVRTHADALKAALDDRAPKTGQHRTVQLATTEGRDAVHDWLDDLQDGLEMAMEEGFPGSESFPVRFKFDAENQLGTVAVTQLASELVEDLATFGDSLADFGLDAAFVAEGRALVKGNGAGVEGTSGALGTQRAATTVVEAERAALRVALRVLRIAHRRAQRKAQGKLPELDYSPLSLAYATRRAPRATKAGTSAPIAT